MLLATEKLKQDIKQVIQKLQKAIHNKKICNCIPNPINEDMVLPISSFHACIVIYVCQQSKIHENYR
jgi:hypothetical protein